MNISRHFSLKLIVILTVWITVSFTQEEWTLRNPLPTEAHLLSAAWTGTQLVAVGSYGTILTSLDGTAWTKQSSGTLKQFNEVIWTGTLLVTVGGYMSDPGIILTSSDGVIWAPCSLGTINPLNAIVWSGTLLVAVGNSGTVLTSTDGVTWTPRSSGSTSNLSCITWDGTQFVACGIVGLHTYEILTSPDGITWTEQSTSTPSSMHSVIRAGSQLVAVGLNGTILTSPDGITWKQKPAATAAYLQSVIRADNQLVAVGWSGAILTSPLSTPIIHDQQHAIPKQSPLLLLITSQSRAGISFVCTTPRPSTVSASLYNLRGQSVVSITKKNSRNDRQIMRLPLNGIAAGAYYLVVKTGEYWERLFVVVR